ncbi:MAG: ECF transporter S component [Clostridia bacterium]|nr:ECF transporter S component [Clostridia bacterium]
MQETETQIPAGQAEAAAAQAVANPAEAEQIQVEQKTNKKSAKEVLKNYFTATRIAYLGVFTALAFALRLLQFSVLPAVPYLQLDFSDTFVMVCAYALGPVAGMICGVLKELIYGICFTKTAFVGELANVIIMLPLVLIPSVLYKKNKGIKSVIIAMSIACAVRVAWSFPVNWLLNFPVFVGMNWETGMPMFLKVWYWAMLFNLIKTVALAVTTLLLYKPLSRLIKLTSEKFEAVSKKRKKV